MNVERCSCASGTGDEVGVKRGESSKEVSETEKPTFGNSLPVMGGGRRDEKMAGSNSQDAIAPWRLSDTSGVQAQQGGLRGDGLGLQCT